MKRLTLFISLTLVFGFGCSPTPTPTPALTPKLQATETNIAANIFATQTANVPTIVPATLAATPTLPPPTLTNTPTTAKSLTPTLTHAPMATPKPVTPTPTPLPVMLVTDFYIPSGFMGDGEDPERRYVQLDTGFAQGCFSPPSCTQVSFKPGPKGWAGIYWQFPEKNWGDQPGKNLSGAKRVVFWAKAQNGGERVQFKAGGINTSGKPFRDSFDRSLDFITLTNTWQQYTIDLTGQDLSNVIGAFAWIARKDDNPQGLVFYLDDVSYFGISRPR